MPRRTMPKSNKVQELLNRLNRDFSVDLERCEHDTRFNDPASRGRVWKRCAICGFVLSEHDRCPQVNPDGTRCLNGVADGYQTCYSHSEQRKQRTPVPPVWESFDK